MDVIKYRHYVVSDAKYSCIACNKGDVLVRKGHAYYLNEHKFIVGYQTVLLRSFSIGKKIIFLWKSRR